MSIMSAGKTAIITGNMTKEILWKTVDEMKPGFAFAFPTFLVAIADGHGKDGNDFSSIEVIFTAGVAVTPAIRQSLQKLPNLKDLIVAYGLTEGLIVTTAAVLLDDDDAKKGVLGIRDLPDFSVGKVCPGTELQVINPDTMSVLGPNEQGEICVKTPALFHSYLNNREAKEKAFHNGYFRTGDIGYFDENGFIYLKDRLKEIFKYFNNHISPTELENVIGKHPKVGEVCVVGISDSAGHVPRAFVRLTTNSGNKNEIAREIQEFADAKLAEYKQLRGGVYIIEELPKGKTGKISRQILEKLDISEL
jgi:acyl-CoA synthetase (AMP-forming)/AMP-acid ligase II